MTDTSAPDRKLTLEPVHVEEDEHPQSKWSSRLVLLMRVLACVSLLKGLFHWAIICGLDAPGPAGFEDHVLPYKAATIFFAVIDLVAAVGLWLAAVWGAVVWLTAAISMAAIEFVFPQVFGGSLVIVVLEVMQILAYLVLSFMTARQQPA